MDRAEPPENQPPRVYPPLPPPPSQQPGWVPSASDPVMVAGRLSPLWRLTFALSWAAVVVGLGTVWTVSRVVGLSTWWLGADSEPNPVLFQLLPFYAPLLVTVAALSNWRHLPHAGVAASLLIAAAGLGDLNRVKWIAVVELVLAAGALCVSLASFAGLFRGVQSPSAS